MEKQNDNQPKGKTISQKYSTWNNGQHYVVFLQTVPQEQKKVLLGRLYWEGKGKQVIRDPRGNQIGEPFKNRQAAEKYMEEHGEKLGRKELELNQEIEQTPAAEKPKVKNYGKEMSDIRQRKAAKTKSKSINR